jgi:hypothetical protein
MLQRRDGGEQQIRRCNRDASPQAEVVGKRSMRRRFVTWFWRLAVAYAVGYYWVVQTLGLWHDDLLVSGRGSSYKHYHGSAAWLQYVGELTAFVAVGLRFLRPSKDNDRKWFRDPFVLAVLAAIIAFIVAWWLSDRG